jgi:hypothetical protein
MSVEKGTVKTQVGKFITTPGLMYCIKLEDD